MLYLQDSKVESFKGYFNLDGEINHYQGNKKDKLIHKILDNTNNLEKEQNINCLINEITGKK